MNGVKTIQLTRKELNDFIWKQRRLLDTKENNIFALTLAKWDKYLDYLTIILNRYSTKEKEYKNLLSEQIKALKRQNRKMTHEEVKRMRKICNMGNNLSLEVESFYLFSCILLDKIANFFSKVLPHKHKRGIKFKSHDNFWSTYHKSQSVKMKKSYEDNAKWLSDNLIKYRDKTITHTYIAENTKRLLIDGFTFHPDKEILKTSITLYPDEKSSQNTKSIPIEKIAEKLRTYIHETLEVIKLNWKSLKLS